MTIDRRTLREQVKNAIVSLVLSGEIEPGERLVELRLADRFGVSQAPVREALRDLEAVGLVNSLPNRGTFAGDFGPGMHEIFQVRGALEELATRLATPLFADDIGSLQAEVDAMTAAAEQGDSAEVTLHSRLFHAMIIDAPGNSILSRVWRGLNIEAHTTVAVEQRREALLAIASSHQPIVDAIKSGNVELACEVTRNHQADLEAIIET